MIDSEKILMDCFKDFIYMLEGHQTPETMTFVVFIHESNIRNPYYIYPYKDENSEDFAIRSGALKKEIGSDITIVYNKNPKTNQETVTMAHHDSKTAKMFNRTKKSKIELLGWYEIFELNV